MKTLITMLYESIIVIALGLLGALFCILLEPLIKLNQKRDNND